MTNQLHLTTAQIESISPEPSSPRQVTADWRKRIRDGVRILPAGEAKDDIEGLMGRYVPRHKIELFDAHFWLCDMRHDDFLNFLVTYVGIPGRNGKITKLYPRIFYKDASLVWRVASHFISEEDEHWIGKGDVRWEQRADGEYLSSAEETTNLPYELQAALDQVSRAKKSRKDEEAVHLILRRGGKSRTHPFSDFSKPREVAAKSYRVNGGKPIVRFRKKGDPESMVYTKGYEPDFQKGLIDQRVSGSRLYGGELIKWRFLSKNGEIQYQFVSSPTHVFANHPQTLTTELMTYGTRLIDVFADDDAFIPGFEYHFVDDDVDPPELYSQIPEGYVGVIGDPDPERADANPWLEHLPIVRDFRRLVLGQRGR